MKSLLLLIIKILDPIISILIIPPLILLKTLRRLNISNFYFTKKSFNLIGVFPIINSFYEPKFNFDNLAKKKIRNINIDLNIEEQLEFINNLNYTGELNKKKFNNVLKSKNFCSGDIEFWYQIIRKIKPKNIIEIGSGNSTIVASMALIESYKEVRSYKCNYTVIDPYSTKEITYINIKTILDKVENTNLNLFRNLKEGDILFIDSSHIIRPDGDLLFIFLEVLPALNKGVIHFHDIFTPYDYPDKWLYKDIKFWNEQYLLESLILNNNSWKVISSLYYLKENYYDELSKICPFLNIKRKPGSFYIKKIS